MTLGLKKRYFDFPGGTMEKNPSADAGDTGDASLIPGSGRYPGGGSAVFFPGKSHEQRSLVGYSPWSGRAGHD